MSKAWLTQNLLCKAALVLLVTTALVAQNGSHDDIPSCGPQTKHHECRCLERTQAIKRARYDACFRETLRPDGTSDEKALEECNRTIPDHCAMAETVQNEDGETFWDGEQNGFVGEKKMGPLCSFACKPHDCTCTEETCHLSHNPEDHVRHSSN